MSFSLPFDQIEAPSVTALAEQISARARRMQRQLEVAEGAAKPGAHALAIDEQRDRIEQRRQLLAQRKAARAAGLGTPSPSVRTPPGRQADSPSPILSACLL